MPPLAADPPARPSVLDGIANDNPVTMPDITFSLNPASDLDSVRQQWLDLERRAEGSWFQSWGWIGTWLASLPLEERPSILVGRCGDRVVALAALGRRTRWRFRCMPSRALFLNETGDPRYDALTIEYNGILAEHGLRAMVLTQALRFLQDRDRGWDELLLSGVTQGDLDSAASVGLRIHLMARQPCDYIDLGGVRAKGADYLGGLSRNSRYQIRRALRLYNERGQLVVTAAQTAEEARSFLIALKELHQANWNERGQPGAFANPYFETFHLALIRDRFAHGEIELLRIGVAGVPIGYLYNFMYAGHVYSYQSGFRYEANPAVKPGLVSHYLAIERHLAAGATVYDFMAGANQYKQSLSTDRAVMLWASARRDRLRFRLEESLRAVKHFVELRVARRSRPNAL